MENVHIRLSGDTSIDVEFGTTIDYEINKKVQALCSLVENGSVPGVVEVVPTYRSLTIHYNPHQILYGELVDRVNALLEKTRELDIDTYETVEIPVCYGGEYGPDIEHVAEYNGITEQEVVRIHSAPDYFIYMLGFTPGFTYLGGMDDRIETPRLASPRQRIPGGSVGIAGKQTGVYPIDSPGGWQIIGRTPVLLYNPLNEKPILLKAGQHIRFVPVTRHEYERIRRLVERNRYECHTYRK